MPLNGKRLINFEIKDFIPMDTKSKPICQQRDKFRKQTQEVENIFIPESSYLIHNESRDG